MYFSSQFGSIYKYNGTSFEELLAENNFSFCSLNDYAVVSDNEIYYLKNDGLYLFNGTESTLLKIDLLEDPEYIELSVFESKLPLNFL